MSTIDMEPGDSFDTEVYEDLDVIDFAQGPVEVPKGAKLVFRTRKKMGGDLNLLGHKGSALEVTGEPDSLKVLGGENLIVIVWGDGLLEAKVPSESPVEVRTTGGDVGVSGLYGDIMVKTLGGGITMQDVSGHVVAKTMGGSILLDASGELRGSCAAKTMGGDISVRLATGALSSLSAKTMGGEVSISEALGEVSIKGGPGASTGTLSCDGGADSSLAAKTLGGNISVERREDG